MADEEKKGPKTQTYYLREGKTHHVAIRGEAVELNRFGQTAELSDAQYKSFKDKFLTEDEYKAQKAGKDVAEGVTAADTLLREQSAAATPEEENAKGNTPATGKNAGSPSGTTSKTSDAEQPATGESANPPIKTENK